MLNENRGQKGNYGISSQCLLVSPSLIYQVQIFILFYWYKFERTGYSESESQRDVSCWHLSFHLQKTWNQICYLSVWERECEFVSVSVPLSIHFSLSFSEKATYFHHHIVFFIHETKTTSTVPSYHISLKQLKLKTHLTFPSLFSSKLSYRYVWSYSLFSLSSGHY